MTFTVFSKKLNTQLDFTKNNTGSVHSEAKKDRQGEERIRGTGKNAGGVQELVEKEGRTCSGTYP